MARVSAPQLARLLHACDDADTTAAKGHALEDLVCYLFTRVPGISIARRNQTNVFHSEEIDVALFNEKHRLGLAFLPHLILIECKNWSQPLGSADLAWFDHKLRQRGLSFGVLVAMEGITGDAEQKTAAQQVIATALAEQRQVAVITRADIELLTHARELITLLKLKLCDLTVAGAVFP